MRHPEMTEKLSAYLDGALTDAERSSVSAHLQTCEVCRAHLVSLQRTVTLVQTLDPIRAPDGLPAQVRAALEREERARPARFRLVLRWSWRTAGVVAAALLVGIFAFNLLRPSPSPELASRLPQSGKSSEPPAASVDRTQPATPSQIAQGTRPGLDALSIRRVVRTANLDIEVDRFDDASRRLLSIAEGAGGFIADSTYTESGGVPQGSFTLRVPADRFAGVVAAVERVGTVLQRSISGQDVTDEFVDLQARIRNLERHEQRLLTFMDRATKVSELLAIEQELARVRGEIEQLTGRVRVLTNQVDLATIEAGVRQKAKKTSGALWDFTATLERIQAAFVASIRQVLAVVEKIVVLAAALLPVALLAVGGWLVMRRLYLARGAGR